MSQFRLQGPEVGTDLGTVTVTDGATSASVDVPTFGQVPPAVLPLIAGPQADGDLALLDVSRLSNVSAIQWRIRGGAALGTATSQDLSGLGGQIIEVETTSDEGTLMSPPLLVHSLMMHMHGGDVTPMAGHNRDDAAVVGLVSHDKMNRVAVQNGSWSDPATWVGGAVPDDGDSVLIPSDVDVVYDVDAPNVLMRRVRVDGTLRFSTSVSTHLFVRDLIGDRGSAIFLGNSLSDRVSSGVQAVITIEGQSPLDLSEDPYLFSRGIVTLGAFNAFGAEKLNHSLAAFGELAGSTSIVLEKDPVGWGVGDQIIVGGTAIARTRTQGTGLLDVNEDEIVTITSITGNVVTFTPALANTHNNQNTRAPNATDVRPMVQLRAASRNVIIQSEALTPATQRGHIMVMHPESRQDVWDLSLIGLGRTRKDIRIGSVNGDGTFKTYFDNTSVSGDWELHDVPMTTDANVRGRYAYHSHLVGYDHASAGRPQPTLVNVTVEDTPGWGIAHHDCEMDIRSSSVFRFYGAGVVAEQGAELGVWDDLSVMQATAVNTNEGTLESLTKGQQSQNYGLGGDFFNDGYGYGYRGRALKVTRCVATSCCYGHVFWHRGLSSDGHPDLLFQVSDPPRDRMDLGEVGQFNNDTLGDPNEFKAVNYPIVHFADCMSIGCYFGTSVSKQAPQQGHDYNVLWKGFTAWGCLNSGVFIEYVGTYILSDIRVVDGPYGGQGIDIGANTYQIAIIRPRTEGCSFNGIRLSGSSLWADKDAFDAATDPRFWVIGHDSLGDTNEINYINGSVKTLEQIAVVDADLDGSYIDFTLDPTEDYPDIIATWNGTNADASIITPVTNATGMKYGNHPGGLPIAPKTWADSAFVDAPGTNVMRTIAQDFGFYQYLTNDVMVQREVISDVLTGRPAKFTAFWQADNPVDIINATDNGLVTMGSAVAASDILLTVAPGASVTVDALAGVTGGTGSFEIDPGDHTAPDYGKLDIDYATGQVTYTAREGVEDQSDFGYLFVRSLRETGATDTETRTYATRRVAFLITNDATLAAPLYGTDFTFQPSSGDTNFSVNLLQRPRSGGRRILVTEYSTDAGATWRRLCNGWPLVSVPVFVGSDGSALTPGLQNVRLRYLTDHEYGYSPETADIAAVVGQPTTLIFGQSNAGFIANADSLQNEIAALGGDTVEVNSAVGGAGATGATAPWNIVDGDPGAGSAYTDLLADVSAHLTANPHAFIAHCHWQHGETDAPQAPTRGNYEPNVTAIFDGLRALLGYNPPITVTGISKYQGGWTDFANDEMNGFMQDLATNVADVYFVDLEAIVAAQVSLGADDAVNEANVRAALMNDNLHWNDTMLDLIAGVALTEPAIRARYGLVS